jgi:hypothetical protein
VYSPHKLTQEDNMRSSTQYAELAGLRIALSGLLLSDLKSQSHDYTVAWIENELNIWRVCNV